MMTDSFLFQNKRLLTACKRNPESCLSGHRLHANRYLQLLEVDAPNKVNLETNNITSNSGNLTFDKN